MMVPVSWRCLGASVTLLVFAMLVHGGACVECMKCYQPLGFLNGAIDHLSFFLFFYF